MVQFRASWSVAAHHDYYVARPAPPPGPAGAGEPVSAGWSPPPIPARLDDETEAALRAWQQDGLPLTIDAHGVAFGGDVAFLLDHDEAEPLTTRIDIARTGDAFTAIGWCDARHRDALIERGHVSDTVSFRKAHILELGPSFRVVFVTASTLTDLSAVANPARYGTSLLVGRPGERLFDSPTGERFVRWDRPPYRA